jgi:lysyl endopeptidase
MSRNVGFRLVVCALALGTASLLLAVPAEAQAPVQDTAAIYVAPLDVEAIRLEDEALEQAGAAPRFAIPHETIIRPSTDGTWDDLDAQTRRWRLPISSPGALSLNLGFTAYYMPPGGELHIYAADGSYELEPYTSANNADHGQLWTAVVLSDDIVVEVTIPSTVQHMLVLELTSINVGYRGFGEIKADRAGSCNIDVICAQGDGWRSEIPAIAVISTGGSLFCTGFMVNDTAGDQTPYFMTANHCGITSSNAASLVVYWNFYSPTCGAHGGGSLATHQTGSTFRATYSTSDFTLVQLSQQPTASWNITYAGWDRRDQNSTSSVCIHHPNCDEKSISFDYGASVITTYLTNTSPGDATHLKTDWDLAVTEPGSSGSPLFDQNHRIIGQLHGGYSACGNSDMRDWYGRFFRSWTGGGSSSTRLSNWLDAGSTGAQYVDTLVPGASGLQVTPTSGLESYGNAGGPFTPSSAAYTVKNVGTSSVNYQVTKTQAWVSLTNASGTLAGGATVTVTVSINATANSLGNGNYADTVTFTNTTNHQGDTTRAVALHVGVPSLVYSWPMDTNPGWTTQGSWAFGHPTGGNGDHGSPDPTNGHTGTNVYGYNLSGGYTNNMSETNLTTTAINCSGISQVSLRFYRWLGVEQSSYDHAYVRVSNNGSTWTTLWENPASELSDTAWVFQQFDISAVADSQTTVYVRWTMGTTDSSWYYCGWNVDDVEIWGVSACTAPAITAQPQNQTRCVGQSVTFSVTATGTAPLSYQWRKGGGNISGATSSSYTIGAVGTGDAGSFDCVVTNGCGSATSSAATLTVNTAPSITAQPQSQTRCVGQSVTFSVTATGTAPLSYQWR